MLIALATLLIFLITGGPEQVFIAPKAIKEIKAAVKDPDRKKDILTLMNEGKKEIKSFRKRNGKRVKSIEKLLGRVASSADEIDAIIQEDFTERKVLQASIIEKRLRLQQLLTQQEWEEIIAPSAYPSPKQEKKNDKGEQKAMEELDKQMAAIQAATSRILSDEARSSVSPAFEAFESNFREHIAQSQKLNYVYSETLRKFGTTKEEMEAFYRDQDDLRSEVYASFKAFLSTTKGTTSDEEWKAMGKAIKMLFK